jgi:hypothetical protein
MNGQEFSDRCANLQHYMLLFIDVRENSADSYSPNARGSCRELLLYLAIYAAAFVSKECNAVGSDTLH